MSSNESERIKIKTEGEASTVYLDGKRKVSFRGKGHLGRANDVAAGMKYGLGANALANDE